MLKAASQQIPAMAQDQHPVEAATILHELNEVDGGQIDFRSPVVPQQDQGEVPADSSPCGPTTAVGADTERFQWLQSPEQDCSSAQDNSIEVRIASISDHGDVPGPSNRPTLPPAPRGQPSTLNSTVPGYQGLLSSPSLDLELPAILESEPTASNPCDAGPSHHSARTLVSASTPRHVDSSGLSDGAWPSQSLQQSSQGPADNDESRRTTSLQAQAQSSAMVTPPSTTAPDSLGIGIEGNADAPCDEVTAL